MKEIVSAIRSLFGGGEMLAACTPKDISQDGLDPETVATKHEQFMSSLVSLLTKVAMADGNVTEDERNTIRDYFQKKLKFDDDRLGKMLALLEKAIAEDPPVERLCKGYAAEASFEERLLLVRLLYCVALADRSIDGKEEALICYIGAMLGLSDTDFTSLWAEFGKDYSRHYDLLGLSSSPTVEQVREAYQKAKASYAPEKVAHLGPEFLRMAERRLALIEQAYKFFQNRLGFE